MFKRSLNLAVFVVIAWVAASHSAMASERFTLNFEGVEREFFVDKPASANANNPLPLVLVLHGGGTSGGAIIGSYGFKPMVNRGEFVAVYPSALGPSWAMDGLPTSGGKPGPTNNDVGFLDAVIDRVLAEQSVNAARMFVTGASRGGLMTQYYLPRSKHRFAGAGSVIAGMTRNIADSFTLRSPVDFAMIIGDNDPFMPYGGSTQGDARFHLLPVDEAIQVVVRANGITNASPTTVSTLGNKNKWDNCDNQLSYWQSPSNQARVALVKVIGGGHVVPGRWQCKDFDHAQVMWQFFKDVK